MALEKFKAIVGCDDYRRDEAVHCVEVIRYKSDGTVEQRALMRRVKIVAKLSRDGAI